MINFLHGSRTIIFSTVYVNLAKALVGLAGNKLFSLAHLFQCL